MFCSNCRYECDPTEKAEGIWDFEPRSYTTYEDLREALRKIPITDFLSKNEDGYTYFHWYIYYVGKVRKEYAKYHIKILWFFDALRSLYPSKIAVYLNEGTTEDPNYTCLHHLFKFCDNASKSSVKQMERFLLQNGTKVELVDAEGYMYTDYKTQQQIPHVDQQRINYFIKCYKQKERTFLKRLLFTRFRESFTFCERCHTEINFIEDLERFVENVPKGMFNVYEQFSIHVILILRKQVSTIYKQYNFNEGCISRHDHIINLYSKLL
jgi:hypothetical protein